MSAPAEEGREGGGSAAAAASEGEKLAGALELLTVGEEKKLSKRQRREERKRNAMTREYFLALKEERRRAKEERSAVLAQAGEQSSEGEGEVEGEDATAQVAAAANVFDAEWADAEGAGEGQGDGSVSPAADKSVPTHAPIGSKAFCKHGWTPKGGGRHVLRDMTWTFRPVGYIVSPFKRKFGIPRQPGIVPAALSRVEFLPPFNNPSALRGIEGFSHIWISFIFHRIPPTRGFKAVIRPPRLGGYKSVGVFATRSTHRPNPLGLSLVELVGVEHDDRGSAFLVIRGADLLDGTPVVDIKPYIAFVDAIPTAVSGFASEPPPQLQVRLLPAADEDLKPFLVQHPDARELITQVLAQDPRPAAHNRRGDSEREYGVRLYDMNVRFRVIGISPDAEVEVMRILPRSLDEGGSDEEEEGEDN